MEITQIVLLVVVLILLVNFIIWVFSPNNELTKMMDGKLRQKILAKTLPNNSNTSNYTYSTWIYINDWNYRFGQPKVILARMDKDGNPSPAITLGAMENSATISVSCYPTGNKKYDKDADLLSDYASGYAAWSGLGLGTPMGKRKIEGFGPKPVTHKCTVQNIPLQKWVNIIVSLYGRTLDVYLDGKLVRTCVLPGVAKVNPDANIIVTPDGGFTGYTTNFKYWAQASNPQEAYDIYKNGLGGSILGNWLNKFRLRISFLANNKEQGSFEI
jgi:hypothetical protein